MFCVLGLERPSYLLTERKEMPKGDNGTIRAVIIDRARVESNDRVCDQE